MTVLKSGMNKILMGMVLMVSFSLLGLASPSHPGITDDDAGEKQMAKDILSYINQYRKEIGKSPLTMVDIANKEASQHSVNMAKQKTAFGHDGFEKRVANISKTIGQVNAAAENVAKGKLTAQEVVKGWLNSPRHKKNIEGDYILTGIGTAVDKKGETYFCQIFLR